MVRLKQIVWLHITNSREQKISKTKKITIGTNLSDTVNSSSAFKNGWKWSNQNIIVADDGDSKAIFLVSINQ